MLSLYPILMNMVNILISFAVSLIASLLAVILALWIDKKRLPKLAITTSEETNVDRTYEDEPQGRAGERWKTFRVGVKNKPFSKPLNWIITRQTAENCRAQIEFFELNGSHLFSMKGRWASTPELPYIPQDAVLLKLLHPDPVTIPVNEQELLDIITKNENDKEAYGWNNEAYLHNWRTTHYKIDRGKYKVKVTVNTQNGVSFNENFELRVCERIEDTYLKKI